VAEVIGRALAPEPQRRPTAEEFGQALGFADFAG